MNEHRVSEGVQKEQFGRIVFVFSFVLIVTGRGGFFVVFFIDLLQYFTLPCLFVIIISRSEKKCDQNRMIKK